MAAGIAGSQLPFYIATNRDTVIIFTMENPKKANDPQPHEDAYQHRDFLRNWIRQRFPLAGDPEDIVQESYARLIQYQKTGPVVNCRAFLFVTARNLALNHIRRAGYENRSVLSGEFLYENVCTEIPSPRQSLAKTEEVALLMEAISNLPPKCRQVFTLRKIYGLSQREIAKRMGISVNTVGNHAVMGLNKCREYFESKGILNAHFQ